MLPSARLRLSESEEQSPPERALRVRQVGTEELVFPQSIQIRAEKVLTGESDGFRNQTEAQATRFKLWKSAEAAEPERTDCVLHRHTQNEKIRMTLFITQLSNRSKRSSNTENREDRRRRRRRRRRGPSVRVDLRLPHGFMWARLLLLITGSK